MEAKNYPSLGYFTDTLVNFDNEVLNLIEKEILKDSSPFLGKRQFLKKLLDHTLLYKRKNHSNVELVDNIIIKLGAMISILGDKPQLRSDMIGKSKYIADKNRPKEKDTLKQSRAVQNLLEAKLDTGSALILGYIISKDETLRSSYYRLVDFYKNLHGSEKENLSSLFSLIPAEINKQSIEYMTDVLDEVYLIPPPKKEIIDFENNLNETINNIKLGKLSFRPSLDSGWKSYRIYSYQTLLNSYTNSEDKLTFKLLFEQALNNNIQLQERDNLSAVKYYRKLAESYSFLLDLLTNHFPNYRNLKREDKNQHLTTELKKLIRLCYGLSVREEKEELRIDHGKEIINTLKSAYSIKHTTFNQLCEDNKEKCLQLASDWESYLP